MFLGDRVSVGDKRAAFSSAKTESVFKTCKGLKKEKGTIMEVKESYFVFCSEAFFEQLLIPATFQNLGRWAGEGDHSLPLQKKQRMSRSSKLFRVRLRFKLLNALLVLQRFLF